MFTKHVVMSCLLLSGVVYLNAMGPEVSFEDSDLGAVHSEARAIEPVAPTEVEDVYTEASAIEVEPLASENVEITTDSLALEEEQSTTLKKKTTLVPAVDEEMCVNVNESSASMEESEAALPVAEPSVADVPTVEMSTDDVQSPIIEDKGDDQGHADVQAVFESMSREEEGESFPG